MLFHFITKIIFGGEENMVELYVALIINDMRKFNKIPSKFQPSVKATLAALGLDENGNPVEE